MLACLYPISYAGLRALPTVSSLVARSKLTAVARRALSHMVCPLGDSGFFNRTKELGAFRHILGGSPSLTIVTGPRNSGKSALLVHLLSKLEEEGRPVLHLNLRDTSFGDVQQFQSVLQEELKSWVEKISPTVTFELRLGPASLSIGGTEVVGSNPLNKLNDLFRKIDAHLPRHSVLTGKKRPILFIDEANRLKTLLRDKEFGEEALSSMFAWFVKNTKEVGNFHVVLASSDSFFHLWASERHNFTQSGQCDTYVVGNLSKEGARAYWDQRVVALTEMPPGIKVPPFSEVYSVCGGNIHFLTKYLPEYIRGMEAMGDWSFERFSAVQSAGPKLEDALYPEIPSRYSSGKPCEWTRDDFIFVMKKLVESPNGFLVYSILCREIGKKAVDSMIEHNLIHLRPVGFYSFDLPNAPEGKGVVTAESPPHLAKMRILLQGIEEELT